MNGAEKIVRERARQIAKEGWTAEHDDKHADGAMAIAAACYAAQAGDDDLSPLDLWPWDKKWDKRVQIPTLDERIRMLEKAGALCAAEIDRLMRLKSGNL